MECVHYQTGCTGLRVRWTCLTPPLYRYLFATNWAEKGSPYPSTDKPIFTTYVQRLTTDCNVLQSLLEIKSYAYRWRDNLDIISFNLARLFWSGAQRLIVPNLARSRAFLIWYLTV